MEVVVADEQLSLAIGRRGQNVKLASKLTGWKIDVRSESVAEEESKRARKALESISGIGIGEAEILFQEGYRSVKDVANAAVEDLISIEGLDAERASLISQGAKELFAKIADGDVLEFEDDRQATDIDQLILDSEIKDVLFKNGYVSIQSLAGVAPEELASITGLAAAQAEKAVSATEAFLRVQKQS